MNNGLINKLVEMASIPSVSGNETEFALWLKNELSPFADKIFIDVAGNLVAIKGKPKIYIFSHMDKVGYMVSEKLGNAVKVVAIKKKKNILEKKWPVTICSKEPVVGFLSQDTDKEYLQIKVKKELLKQISVGDFVALTPNFKAKNKEIIISQGLDNKLGILSAIEVFKRSKDVGFVATVQEETTKLGAKMAAWSLKPMVVIVLDVTYDEGKYIKIGNGPSICMKDDLLPDKNLLKGLIEIVTKYKLTHQLEVIESGGSDANVVYDAHGYTPHLFVGIPIKFMHTPKETAHIGDLETTTDL
ncbi:MAG: hypothetical protein ABIJ85_04860, partial [bacterium]